MECNREEPRTTAGGGPSEWASFSAEKKNSPEAWAAQHPRSESRGPIAEGFSHRASPWDSIHELPGIFSSLPWSKRPISHSVFRRTNRLSRALAGSRKYGREWGLFAPAPAGLIFSTTSTGAKSWPAWNGRISFVTRPVPAPKPHTHRAPLPRAASEPGRSHFAFAYASVSAFAKSLLLIVGRYFARQIERQDPVAVLPAKNLECNFIALLQF